MNINNSIFNSRVHIIQITNLVQSTVNISEQLIKCSQYISLRYISWPEHLEQLLKMCRRSDVLQLAREPFEWEEETMQCCSWCLWLYAHHPC